MASCGALAIGTLTFIMFQNFDDSTETAVEKAANTISTNNNFLRIFTICTVAIVCGTAGVSIIIGIVVLIGRISGGAQVQTTRSQAAGQQARSACVNWRPGWLG